MPGPHGRSPGVAVRDDEKERSVAENSQRPMTRRAVTIALPTAKAPSLSCQDTCTQDRHRSDADGYTASRDANESVVLLGCEYVQKGSKARRVLGLPG